jgi:hypothetical protein
MGKEIFVKGEVVVLKGEKVEYEEKNVRRWDEGKSVMGELVSTFAADKITLFLSFFYCYIFRILAALVIIPFIYQLVCSIYFSVFSNVFSHFFSTIL